MSQILKFKPNDPKNNGRYIFLLREEIYMYALDDLNDLSSDRIDYKGPHLIKNPENLVNGALLKLFTTQFTSNHKRVWYAIDILEPLEIVIEKFTKLLENQTDPILDLDQHLQTSPHLA